MKKVMLALSVIGLLSVNLMAETQPSVGNPTVGDSVSTAPNVKSIGAPPRFNSLVKTPISSLGGTIGNVTVTPVLGPTMSSVSWSSFATKLVADARNRSVKLSPTVITDPTDYTVCYGKVSWSNLIYSTSSAMWGGKLNPASPFQNEKGQIVSQLVQAESVSGDNTISMSMLSVSCESSDGGNILGDQILFIPADYSSLAIGIRSDGTVITSGRSDQKVARIILITSMKLFNGGANQAGLDQVENWVAGKGNFTITYSAQIIGDAGSTAFAPVSILGYSNVRPLVSINRQSGVISVTGGENRYYSIMTTTDLNGSSWQSAGSVYGNGNIPMTFTGNRKFFRAVAQ
ncbi:MAG: hypothetical protein WCS89_00775 [Candidatus Paceibacterota bacterium]